MLLGIWIPLTILLSLVTAEVHTYNFNVTYVTANPDGLFERRVVGINNEWPIPTIKVKKNDRVQIFLHNNLDVNTSLHFHGLFQKGSNSMDGPEMITQCPIAPGSTFLYNFTVDDQTGTYWYHSHSGSQYSDGLRGMFIVEDPEPPFSFDEEVVLSVSDWYHSESKELMKNFLSRYNPTGAEPVPQSTLFNDTTSGVWHVKPSTTYFLRIVNMGMFTSQYLYIEDHVFTVVEIDGVYVKPRETKSLYLSVAQRYGVLVHTKPHKDTNFRFVSVVDKDMLDYFPEGFELVSTNYITYNRNELPASLTDSFEEVVNKLEPIDDFELVPLDATPLFDDHDYQITLNFTMDNLGDGVNYAFFNKKTFVPPKVPTLMTVMSSGEHASQQVIYGSNTNSFVLQHNEVIEIVLNNMDPGKHPFHLHGHTFQVISRSKEGDEEDPIIYNSNNPEHTKFPEVPMMRDTVLVNANGFVVLRFKADNPGVWFFHCHVDWHLEQGLAITLIEAPMEIQKTQSIPQDHFEACQAANISSVGNAAGRFGDSKDEWLNLEGEPLQFPPLPPGFTTKGYIAFIICTVIALQGIFSIYKYGMEDISTDNSEHMIQKLHSIIEKYDSSHNGEESTRLTSVGDETSDSGH